MHRILKPCPPSPNCVSSDATDRRHRVAPFMLAMPAERAWPIVREVVGKWPRTRIVTEEAHYLHAECTTQLLRFVDDLELALDAERQRVAVRSASRVGWSDLGANRKRVEALRAALVSRGIVRAASAERTPDATGSPEESTEGSESQSRFGCMRGTVEITGDIVSPVSDQDWDALR